MEGGLLKIKKKVINHRCYVVTHNLTSLPSPNVFYLHEGNCEIEKVQDPETEIKWV